MSDPAQEPCQGQKCPSVDARKWAKFLSSVLVLAAPHIPGIGPIILANPELSITLTGGLMALITGEAPMAVGKRVVRKSKKEAEAGIVDITDKPVDK